ncbi:hypothetical protein, partial [Achromobacter sp. GbtcB20]|uniref:hypothetical protein n=1 Tax=Achromobacter sp. GbtcB20 TaxID=2824765 RepID=UPI001C3016F0
QYRLWRSGSPLLRSAPEPRICAPPARRLASAALRCALGGTVPYRASAFDLTKDMSRSRLHPPLFLAGALACAPALAVPGTALDLYG